MLFRCHDGYVKKGLMEMENIKKTETSTYLFSKIIFWQVCDWLDFNRQIYGSCCCIDSYLFFSCFFFYCHGCHVYIKAATIFFAKQCLVRIYNDWFLLFLKFVRSLYCVVNQNVILYLNFFNIRVRRIVLYKKYKDII